MQHLKQYIQLSFSSYVEKYETPERILKMDMSSIFSSPNDLEGQNDIFWDQNSPMTKQLGNCLLTFLFG